MATAYQTLLSQLAAEIERRYPEAMCVTTTIHRSQLFVGPQRTLGRDCPIYRYVHAAYVAIDINAGCLVATDLAATRDWREPLSCGDRINLDLTDETCVERLCDWVGEVLRKRGLDV
jgi:hypothetical protein